MKIIYAFNGEEIFVDNEDYPYLNQFAWSVKYNNYYTSAYRTERIGDRQKMILMQREIMGVISDKQVVIHRNGEWFDNQKKNLIVIKKGEQNARRKKNYSSKLYKGVHFNKRTRKYIAAISKNGRKYYLGSFDKAEEAAIQYDVAANKLSGKIARTNKDLGIIRYKAKKKVQIKLEFRIKGHQMDSPEDRKRVKQLRSKILKLRTEYTYPIIGKMVGIRYQEIYRFAIGDRGLRSIAFEKLEKAIYKITTVSRKRRGPKRQVQG
ncbi:AP2 domain-containing protein [Leptospira sp. id769339]|uniref:AP2 domain-containing protein n=1 Tax=Leptospira sp. id769339 TaxID=2864221 RepID=UPI00214B3B6A|nr:AP2 domain-containing protein [Leptospira sp. id769339]MCR1795353.1 Fis family transcriptional regulator [Leptospira sp. id769339]